MKKISLLLVALLFCLNLLSFKSVAGVLFTENFEAGLSQWTGTNYGNHNGIIVDDPLRPGNKVLSFNRLANGGDIFHRSGIELVVGETYEISVEYLGLQIPGVSKNDNYGGFFGISDIVGDSLTDKAWIFGTKANYPYLRGHLIDDNQWRTYKYTFVWHHSEIDATDDTVHIMMEDWVTSAGSFGDVFFDNIKFNIVPEPFSFLLIGFGALIVIKQPKHRRGGIKR